MMPVAGEIVEVNEDLACEPGLLNTDPCGKGWIFKMKPTNLEELTGLMGAEKSAAHIG